MEKQNKLICRLKKNICKISQIPWGYLIPIFIIILAISAFFFFRLYRYFSIEMLRQKHIYLQQWVNNEPVTSGLLFMLLYTIIVAFSIPEWALLTVIGGYLFGPVLNTFYVIISTTIGATILFVIVKSAFRNLLYHKIKKFIDKISDEIHKNKISFLLFVRLVPIFPFWIVNIVLAFFDIDIKLFAVTTGVGILPVTFFYSLLGDSIKTVIDQSQNLSIRTLINAKIYLLLFGFAVLSLLPILYKYLKKKNIS